MGFIGFNFNLLDQLSFYGFYHQKHGNQFIHFFFVPAILWSVCVWFAYTGALGGVDLPAHLSFLPEPLAKSAEFNLASVLIGVFTAYFTILEPFAGLSWGTCIGLSVWLSATWVFSHVANAWAWALGVHIISWIMQVNWLVEMSANVVQVLVGHIIIEGRKPALLDSLFQSLVLASLFAWMEGLFALGYRRKLQAELSKRIAEKDRQCSAEASQPLLTNPGPVPNSTAQ